MKPNFETVQSDVDSSFRSIRFTCASFAEDHSWHYHPEFELTWIIRSEGTRFIGDSIAPYRADDLVLIGPNLPHCYHDEPAAIGGNPGPDLIVLQFRPEIFGTEFLGLPEARRINELLLASKRGLHVQGETSARVRDLMLLTLKKRGMPRLMCLLEILQTLTDGRRNLRSLASADHHIDNDITQTHRDRIELIHRYVRENLARQISQREIAALVNLTPQPFSRFYRKATGQTFVRFVNTLRINAVCRWLVETDDGITSIAMNCGYNNIAHFNRQFIALRGMTPRQFRERALHLQDRTSTHRPKQPALPAEALHQ
ncbi:helix-turn-helix domain-containing protein [Steroidobacter flavus]|uniref:Helix-turn-helix domain-containing protein n=1 Tax=Steroidobacter flavus TaxID=1842136 RepID=A0ABV8SYF7_9GAMM